MLSEAEMRSVAAVVTSEKTTDDWRYNNGAEVADMSREAVFEGVWI